MDALQFGKFIQTLRKEQGMTQDVLGQKLGVTGKAVSRWERGVGFPDISLLEPLAQALGVTVVELMRSERMPEESITVSEAGDLVADSLRLAREQERFLVRSRLLKFLGIPAVFGFWMGMEVLVRAYVTEAMWVVVLINCFISLFCLLTIRGIWYVAGCRYLEEPKKGSLPRQVSACVSAIGFVAVVFAMLLNTDGLRQYYAPVTLLGLALMAVWPLYEAIGQIRKKAN